MSEKKEDVLLLTTPLIGCRKCGEPFFIIKVVDRKDGTIRPDYQLTCTSCGDVHGCIGWINI